MALFPPPFFLVGLSLHSQSPHFLYALAWTGSFPQLLVQSDLSMLSSSPASCTSPNPGTDNPDKKVHWASEKRRRASSTDSESKTHLDISKLPRSRRPSRLTVKYDRGHLQRWLEMEQWVDAQVQELFQVGSLKGRWRLWIWAWVLRLRELETSRGAGGLV